MEKQCQQEVTACRREQELALKATETFLDHATVLWDGKLNLTEFLILVLLVMTFLFGLGIGWCLGSWESRARHARLDREREESSAKQKQQRVESKKLLASFLAARGSGIVEEIVL